MMRDVVFKLRYCWFTVIMMVLLARQMIRMTRSVHVLVEPVTIMTTQSMELFLDDTNNDNHFVSVVEDFVHQVGVAIVMKIHGPDCVLQLKQSLCLLHAAYNKRVLYDIIVFVTLSLSQDDMDAVQSIVAPAKLMFVFDEKTLQEQLNDLTLDQRERLLSRCQDVNTTHDFVWQTRCVDHQHIMPIAYCWMSEFRSKQIWTQTVLRPYKYMMWYDTDSFATRAWDQDPVAFMIRNDLVLLMGNYPYGTSLTEHGTHRRIYKAYNKTLCHAEIIMTPPPPPNDGGSSLFRQGTLQVEYGDLNQCHDNVQQVHGFFHITNLDFYRLPQNLYWYDVLIGDGKFQRVWDDQLAVIVPAAMLAPHRTMEMEAAGLQLNVFHNLLMMGKRRAGGGYNKLFRNQTFQDHFPEAYPICEAHINIGHRL